MDVSVELVKRLLPVTVHLHAHIPRAHPSSALLGTERMGSGVIVDPGGLILTVNYVVMGAQTLEVGFVKGRRARGEVVAQDFETGLAVVRVKRQGLPAAPTSRPGADLKPGEPVIAVGATGTQERRIAGGLVTYVGEFEAYWEYMIDQGIIASAGNPGFGGGGLFTVGGRLTGVLYLALNELLRSSMSIPVDCYRSAADELVRFGRVVSRPRRAWLGVFAHVVDEGVVVAGVVPDGPGDKGGLREGDVIVSLNAAEVGSRRELYLNLWRHQPGERLTLEVMRDNQVRRVELTGGDRAHFFRQP